MSDLNQLESETLSAIAAAHDEGALEAVRLAALGKKGSVSALLSTLGKMSPDERKTAGAAIKLDSDGRLTEAAPPSDEEKISRFEHDTCVQWALREAEVAELTFH